MGQTDDDKLYSVSENSPTYDHIYGFTHVKPSYVWSGDLIRKYKLSHKISTIQEYSNERFLKHPKYKLFDYNCQDYAKELIAFMLSESDLKDKNGKFLIELENEGKSRAL